MKTILITGATSGIGEALCQHYQQFDNQVIACGRNTEKLAQLERYANIRCIAVDLCDETQLIQQMQHLTVLDLVILNAGSCEYIDDAKQFDGALFARV